MKRLILICALGLSACVTPQVTTQRLAGATAAADFTRYRDIHFVIGRSDRAEITSGFGDEEISLFETLLQRKLAAMGYNVVDSNVAELNLIVTVLAAKPGNAAARFLVGFGAGRGVFTFDAKFQDDMQREIASFTGGQAYTGLEFGAGLSGEDTIMTAASTSAVSQIEKFMRNGGKFQQVQGNKQ